MRPRTALYNLANFMRPAGRGLEIRHLETQIDNKAICEKKLPYSATNIIQEQVSLNESEII
jgi:hypothetical protein